MNSICFLERASTRNETNVHYLLDSCHMRAWSRWHITCLVGSSHSSHHPAESVDLAPCESEDKIFDLPCDYTIEVSLTWLCRWISFIKSHHSVRFGVHTLHESGNITLLVVKWTRCGSVTWHCVWGPLILKHHPAKFRVHRPCESTDTFLICHVTTWSMCHMTL